MSGQGYPNRAVPGMNGSSPSPQLAPQGPPGQQPPPCHPRRRTARDYQFGTRIGEGSYSTVFSAVDLYNKKTYAVKVLSKKHIVQEDKIKYVNIEKTTLHRLGVQHPGIVQLYYTFQDESSLFFVLDFAEYGELLSIISKFGSLSEPVSKFYMSQILDAVKFIHSKGVIHRDLKPENILVGYDFNLKITDFGAAKLLGDDDDLSDEKINFDSVNQDLNTTRHERKGSFVGTAEYVPPELLKHNVCSFETDIWAMGCILFQFFNGIPPFKGSTEYLTFEKIININYTYRENVPPMVKDIIDKILVLEPKERPSINAIQGMQWFSDVSWTREYIWNRKVPRFEPYNPNQQLNSNPPQLKIGANRNFNKSSSNYQLHSQISKFDNLIPNLVNKTSYSPATRIKKSGPIANGVPQPILHNPPPIQNTMAPRVDPAFTAPEQLYSGPSSPAKSPYRRNPPQPMARQAAPSEPQYVPVPQFSQVYPTQQKHTQVRTSPPAPQQPSSFVAAQKANANSQSQSLEKTMAETKISSAPKSPERKNLRANTAFANIQRSSAPTSKPPAAPVIVTNRHTQESPKVQAKPTYQESNKSTVITLREISSFLEEEEKIIKLDCVLKSMLSNKLIDRKPGSLDNDVIESLIERHSSILLGRMSPVIVCISNRAKVFLIDEHLDVMMVDLTANKGCDYSMYDYEFESVIVDDEEDSPEETDVYGYLILELIKEGGDLIFLKRFNESEKMKFADTIKVVGTNGNPVKIGGNFGWIDSLIWAKELVDKETKNKKEQAKRTQNKTSTQPKQKISVVKKQNTGTKIKPSKPINSRGANKAGSKINGDDIKDGGAKPSINKFAYAAAAAVHK